MKSKFASRLAVSILVTFPAAALPACAAVPEASAYAADSGTCRSARQTAELVRQMQMSDGGIPVAIPAECERGADAKKRAEAPRETKSLVERPVLDHSPG